MMLKSNIEMDAARAFAPRHRTLLEALDRAALEAPQRGITVLPDRRTDPEHYMSYRELAQRVDALAAGLHALDVGAGEPVLLVFETGFDFLVSFYACQRLRAIAVPTYPPAGLRVEASLDRIAQLAASAGTRVCLTSDTLAPVVRELRTRVETLQVEALSNVQRVSSLHVAARPAEPRDIAFVQYTSGSTGRPKGVMLSHENLTAHAHTIGLSLQIVPSDVFVNWCPLYHDMGLIGNVLTSLCWQLSLALFSPNAFIREPARWLRAIDAHRGTISTAPNFAYWLAVARVNGKRREGLDLSSWRVAANGAEPVNAQTIEAFVRAYEPYGFRREAMFPVYGLAEASLGVAFPERGQTTRIDRVSRSALARGLAQPAADEINATSFVSVGRAVPGHEVRIVANVGGALAGERTIGEIQSRGPSVMAGYFNNPDATAEAFDGDWLRTGDLGYWADGDLFIVGRSKDVIIVRGQKRHPEDIEGSIDALEGLRTGNVIAFGVYDEAAAEDRLVIVAEYGPGSGEKAALVQRIRDTVIREHALVAQEVLLVARNTIPKTSSGKRQRALCRTRYLAGELQAAVCDTQSVTSEVATPSQRAELPSSEQ